MPTNQPPIPPNAINSFFTGSNQSQVQIPTQFISPNNQNTVFVNNLNIPKAEHLLPSFMPSNGAHQPIYLLPQYGSPQLPFYGQNQPRPHHQTITNDTDYSQHNHLHQSYSAAKPPSTNPIGNTTNGKSPAELEDERHSIKKPNSSNHSLPSTPDVNSAASTLLNFDHKNTTPSDSKKDVMSIENLSAPLVT